MRTENIEVTFKIPIPVDKPDLNGVIYSKEAIRNAYKNVKDIPIEIPCSDGQFLPIGVAQEVELIEDEDGMYVTGVGLVWHGGTDESLDEVLKACDIECGLYSGDVKNLTRHVLMRVLNGLRE